ncbi:MAG: phosphatidate cytidylyltransferase [Candidatus Hatepunaea meridiana]|nr:phosphatidate cytidylyltransferase [Candidatus Hatepunaea meridiana]
MINAMFSSVSSVTLITATVCLLVVNIVRIISKKRSFLNSYLTYTLVFFICFLTAQIFSYKVGIWVLALLSFTALREYFSLINIRLQDRLGILGAYLSIPFMYYLIQIDWYGMFIISIPVYTFLAIPLLVSLGGKETQGTVFSIGAIDFGLFLCVFCIGHIGYLLSFAIWKAVFLVINVAICDVIIYYIGSRFRSKTLNCFVCWLLSLPLTIPVSWLLCYWTGIPPLHSIILGAMIPALVIIGHRSTDYVKADLGVTDDVLFPGRGQIMDNLKSFFYAAPVMFHYIRYFLT